MRSSPWERSGPGLGGRALAGILTVVTSAAGLAEWLLLRSAILAALAASGTSPWTWALWDKLGFLFLGILWLVLVYLSSYHYQKALRKSRLRRAFAGVSLSQAALLALTLLVLRLLG